MAFVVLEEADSQPRPLPADVAAELRRDAEKWLTGAMLPTAWFQVHELPRSPNGKLDRPTLTGWATQAVPAVPATVTGSSAQAVAEVWERVLGTPVTDTGATFFSLGGTSSGVLRALAQLQPRYPRLHAADLFRHTTLRTLAAHLDTLDGAAERTDPQAGGDRARTVPAPSAAGKHSADNLEESNAAVPDVPALCRSGSRPVPALAR
ncbi:hypothetical protein BJ970_004346 [Saccharopolyspora phatthalungensis]|uniref:Carrier domain-containing protein n=1 Tax=Saccharopolyspora phatthalungensis TaxID=664693 RepID=A0A840Q2R9_9PSEU|nr:hypothetical protein [Saccharopolyspora phatthalungensis]